MMSRLEIIRVVYPASIPTKCSSDIGVSERNCKSRFPRVTPLQGVLLALLLAWVGASVAQEAPLPAETPVADLPHTRHLAAALADPDSRSDTLLTLVAVARLLDYGYAAGPARLDELDARFRDERVWLERLAGRYDSVPLRSSVLDPASWHLLLRLDAFGIAPPMPDTPLGPDTQLLLNAVFNRSAERVAAALLPEVLARMELQATMLWEELRFVARENPTLLDLVLRLEADWFDPWVAAEPPAPASREQSLPVIEAALKQLRIIAWSALDVGPPDALRLKRLRFNLLQSLPMLGAAEADDARYLLVLANAVDGLAEGKYLQFTEALLWVASAALLTRPAPDPELAPLPGMLADPGDALPPDVVIPEEMEPIAEAADEAGQATDRSPIPGALAEMLPPLSKGYAHRFSEVDPRINSSLATVFEAMQYLHASRATAGDERLAALRADVADAVAQMVLLIPDMAYYFGQPVRQAIANEADRCIGIIAEAGQPGQPPIGREPFDSCLENLVGLAGEQAARPELAGDPDGPFGTDQLLRELVMTAPQRVNYALGYLQERAATDCELPGAPLPNPLEWASLAALVDWFAEQSPVYFQTPANEGRVVALRAQGMNLMRSLTEQVDCISGSGAGISDPVMRSLRDYRASLDELIAGIREAEIEFRENVLKPGSDVVLHGDATQRTAFRSEELEIGPCDPLRICEASGTLETTRALIGQFPDVYLIADQIGLGEIEICYDNVQWVNRRSEPVRAEDPYVANYFGQLSFDLVGRYREDGGTTEVFGARFTSPSEYHYLFAAAEAEVLDDACPTEWIGSRIVTPMVNDPTVRVVPNRLTYLAAARRRPSELLSANWARNEEWRDSFVTGLNIVARDYEPDAAIFDRVNQRLASLYRSKQLLLYQALLNPPSRSADGPMDSLFGLLRAVNARKTVVSTYVNLFYPHMLVDSDELRSLLHGHGALLDSIVLRRLREENLAVSAISELGIARLDRLQTLWRRQPEAVRRSGTVTAAMAHALVRLNALYAEYFRAPDAAVPEAVTPPVAGG
jgi:hypothetical protein